MAKLHVVRVFCAIGTTAIPFDAPYANKDDALAVYRAVSGAEPPLTLIHASLDVKANVMHVLHDHGQFCVHLDRISAVVLMTVETAPQNLQLPGQGFN